MRRQRPQEHMAQPPPGRTGTGAPLPAAAPPGPTRFQVATNQSDAIAAFLSSGGYTFWPQAPSVDLTREGEDIDYKSYVKGDGAQLVASAFIPWGKVGFCKQIRVAPLKPSILSDVWSSSGITAPGTDPVLFGTYQATRDLETYTGIWDVPMGWESYDVDPNPLTPGGPSPRTGGYVPDPWLGQLGWQWQLTLLDGSIPNYRTSNNIPPFEVLNVDSWFMVDSIPVPGFVYSNGFPGRPAGPGWTPQRMQVLPGDSLDTHIIIPSNTTLCLWARWYNVMNFKPPENGGWQVGVPLRYARTDVFGFDLYGANGDESNDPVVPVIGPSIGSLHGYMQPEVSDGSNVNAVKGWGG
jgi:hypothetical protein